MTMVSPEPKENLWFIQNDHCALQAWAAGFGVSHPGYKIGHCFLPIWAALGKSLNVT